MKLNIFKDDLEEFLEDQYSELEVIFNEEDLEIVIILENPNINNYNDALEFVELFFIESNKYHIESFEIDGDYEGTLTLLFLE